MSAQHMPRKDIAALGVRFLIKDILKHSWDPMPRALMLIDVRDFHEEAYDLRGSASHGHTGLHPENLIRIMRHENFKNSYGEFLSKFRELMRCAKTCSFDRVGVAFVCNKGRDRSVGCRRLMKFMLQEFTLSPVFDCSSRDICKWKWRRTRESTCPTGSCRDCYCDLSAHPSFMAAFQAKTWNSLTY